MPAQQAPKQRLSRELFAGRVTQWKNTYGWIEPLEPIEHPDIKRHQGKIFVHSDDISNGRKQLRVGCICEFYLYQDEQGLGADEVLSRQVVRILMPTAEAKIMFDEQGQGVPAFEDRNNVSLRVYEWYNNDGSTGTLPFLIECWGRPECIISAVKEFKNRSSKVKVEGEDGEKKEGEEASKDGEKKDGEAESSEKPEDKKQSIDFLVPQSRLWLLDLDKMRQVSEVELDLKKYTAIDDPMPCYPLCMKGTDDEVGRAVSVLIEQICDH